MDRSCPGTRAKGADDNKESSSSFAARVQFMTGIASGAEATRQRGGRNQGVTDVPFNRPTLTQTECPL